LWIVNVRFAVQDTGTEATELTSGRHV
jgi:hypothetical protein